MSVAGKGVQPPRLNEWQRSFLAEVIQQKRPLTHTQAVLLRRVADETGVSL